MGVMLDPAANPNPTEEEIARSAGLIAGSPEEAKFLAMRKQLDEKGFLVEFGAHRLELGLLLGLEHHRRIARRGRHYRARGAKGHSHSSAPFFHA